MQKNIDDLLTLQASLLVLENKARNFHWSIRGHDFFPIHEELGKLYEETTKKVDLVAEKIVMLNGYTNGSYEMTLEKSLISKDVSMCVGNSAILPSSKELFKILQNDLKTILEFVGKMENVSFRVQPILDEIILFLDMWLWKVSKSLELNSSCSCQGH
ncbi:DNA starvation/stationary phase protection protein [Mycoplasma tullyi]|uniref:DNA starvation/stationary phase protection protein n=1 Tax=Mycoplasma tullyi TaxID=1612150 RepID=A0A7D7XVU7_9MOLU|nr:ferritin-like domain-containing protein [Mycoplasma tullyi]QMT98694.1 DNA starvation/stationary phase protection protein [Mycoplasma tullyi]